MIRPRPAPRPPLPLREPHRRSRTRHPRCSFPGARRDLEPAPRDLAWGNHAKIVAVDGQRLMTGGHNMWTRDYLERSPVHDISMPGSMHAPPCASACTSLTYT